MITGASEFAAKLIVAGQDVPDAAAKALYVEAELIKTVSVKRTPVDTGALRASHEVSKPERQGNTVKVSIGVGGPGIGYAIPVHENLMAFHPVGQAKFLQSAVEDAASGLAARIAQRMGLK